MGKWYNKGFEEGAANMNEDPPHYRGHRDHTAYCEGYADGQDQAMHDAKREALIDAED